MAALTIDVAEGHPEDVDYLRSEAGSWYLVLDFRQVRSEAHPRRFRYEVERLGREVPLDVREATFGQEGLPVILDFTWYSRDH